MQQSRKRCVMILLWAIIWVFLFMEEGANSDPQHNLLISACSQYNVTNFKDFSTNLNATFLKLRKELRNNNYFATADQAATYTMVQCRNYLSSSDCLACFDAASIRIRKCSAANGARVIYDGCFLRYESNNFYTQSTGEGHTMICGNHTASNPTSFNASLGGLLNDLQVATPRIDGFFAASKKEVSGNKTVYGVAQCIETISKSGCQNCMAVVYSDIQQCPPNSDGRAINWGCFLRYSESPFFADNQTTDIAPFLKNEGSSKKDALIGGLVGGIGFLLLVLAVFFWFRSSRRKQMEPRGDILEATELQGPVNYNYRDLNLATRNFSLENKLGGGGFGDVYKGALKNGKVVAVKKLAIAQSLRAKADFESEVRIISNVRHRNLLRLLGCCSKGAELLLVYEFMPNSSLDKFLFGEKKGSLNWKQRYDIMLGTAKGLAYLHEEFYLRIIHRDIKPSNILLDHDFQPKISDFGLARLLPQDPTHLSSKFAGTMGYTAPEYAIHGQLSEKVDAYSYGVLVLEIISSQKSSETNSNSDDKFLLKRAWSLYENNRHEELVDETLNGSEYDAEDVRKVIEIALLCTQASAASRPTMSEVVILLRSEGTLNRRPATKPIFIESDKVVREATSASIGSSASYTSGSRPPSPRSLVAKSSLAD
ncbi:hypothetical protein SLEP1_g50235 [Rubroshorea leprosula]|uniref:Cysteine-rich receptor-like protein kinase 2 n=1 Tax=Rubroshorea leprosula TaxID=152421 RepID=A0AAV5M1P0_9ROSI|nr:hypothetical protein SLEP1_g50235 [Rubroshorea leprosula]